FKEKRKPVFFVGCNFGPYYSEEFVKLHAELFKNVDKIIFRDKKSYQLFPEISSTSYSPDLLWSFKLPEINPQPQTIGISVIDPRHKEKYKHTYNEYIKVHQEFCKQQIKSGNKVILFSFCEKEGDLDIAKEIAGINPEIEIENYEKDINTYLKKIGNCSQFVAARFHAVIIAFKYNI